jgi:hypothetical protein
MSLNKMGIWYFFTTSKEDFVGCGLLARLRRDSFINAFQ